MSWQEALTDYTAAFIDGLAKSGVREAVISPGSRSTPLALLLAEHPDIRIYMNIDERSAAFFALGLAKASRQPVAILCTSGTAAANYYPAVVEANVSKIPLIVLTADRPPELRDVGAPQAIDQLNLYGDHVRWFREMALPEQGENMKKYACFQAARAVSVAGGPTPGPVHLNFPLREPLVPRMDASGFQPSGSFPPAVSHSHYDVSEETIEAVSVLCQRAEKGLIVCGVIDDADFTEAAVELAETLGFPILADPLSQLRSMSQMSELIIDSYDAILRAEAAKAALEPDVVIHFGGLPVSKSLSLFLKSLPKTTHIFVDGNGGWRDPNYLSSEMIYCSETVFCKKLSQYPYKKNAKWIDVWKQANDLAKKTIRSHIDAVEELDEGKAVSMFCDLLPPESAVFVGNSMPIRDMDTFFHANNKNIRLLGNRGANGIDGIVSSAAGAAVHGRPLFLLIGDLSFFHDMNGLLAAKQHNIHLNIILLNNDGGGIFSYLPQAEEGKHFEWLFGTPTGLNFEHAARLYGAQYAKVFQWEDLKIAMMDALEHEGIHIIEIPTDRDKNLQNHRLMWDQVSREINHFFQGEKRWT
jgi:2-succinyl-5-enolpyruvyl-6-hydroxy-3-cyclohexene-1-carboxylate synthase